MLSEEARLEALNSTPVENVVLRDLWLDGSTLSQWVARRGGDLESAEQELLMKTRNALQKVVRGESGPEVLEVFIAGVRKVPRLSVDGLDWSLEVEVERRLAVGLILTWARLREESPGRLRPCANSDCRLFLVDHSRASTARWCEDLR